MDGYDELERKILNGKYRLTDKALYGGLMYGGFVLPINFFKIILTTIFPPIGELLNIEEIGEKALKEIRKTLGKLGITLKQKE